ncbi:prolyl 3-hydroxylase OGFOD1-like [Oppia nitens]|uniref:prolyl 3-hydroxylase OGFOD1-like n=1 Tax=Oppia nitens TaxID=1686743 RepID=UPI0023D9E073|nr:prolyl 3-hydroxylase OGFOD1-like [Oppia nitens]
MSKETDPKTTTTTARLVANGGDDEDLTGDRQKKRQKITSSSVAAAAANGQDIIDDIDVVNINDNYLRPKRLDQLTEWYRTGVKPTPTTAAAADDEVIAATTVAAVVDKDIQLITKPFKVMAFNDFIDDDDNNQDFLAELKREINQLDLTSKNNDLYRLRQSQDLNNITDGLIGRLCRLFAKQVKPFVQRLTGLELNDNIALTVSRYEQNDYLLCHDDAIEEDTDGRRVAFILYLVPDWTASDGGLLDLFDSNDRGEPTDIVASVAPKWNRFAFFEVSPVTWHQVSEVVSDSKIRLSVNGWFHGPRIVRPQPNLEPQLTTEPATDVPLDVVQSWINPLYLDDSTQWEIRSRFGDLSEIVLQDFFAYDKYHELARALKDSEAIVWRRTGPPNMRRYDSASVNSCPAIVLEAYELFRSEAMYLILSNLTGLKLHELAIAADDDDDDDSEDNNSSENNESDEDSDHKHNDGIAITAENSNPRSRGEIRRWSPSYYTLVHDNSAELLEKSAALDVIIHFNCDNREFDRETGGFVSYIGKGVDEELLTIDPYSNNLNIVYRDGKTTRFVKYINSKCVDSIYDMSFVYFQ